MTVNDLLPPLISTFEDDREHDLELARGVVIYLATKGLDRQAVIACLIAELDLDAPTAEELANLAA